MSSRTGRVIAATVVIGGMFSVSTAISCSTQSRMPESSVASGSSSSSATRMRARVAMRATVALSNAMISGSFAAKAGVKVPWLTLSSAMIVGNPAALKAAVAPGARLIGLDVGTKTIGLALSDTRLVIASPLDTIRRRRFRDDMAALFGHIDEHGGGGA